MKKIIEILKKLSWGYIILMLLASVLIKDVVDRAYARGFSEGVDRSIEKGYQAGLEKGLDLGEAEGLLEGKQAMIEHLQKHLELEIQIFQPASGAVQEAIGEMN